jgi:putative Holliday junction resolvase
MSRVYRSTLHGDPMTKQSMQMSRFLGVDFGRRRVGLALSDATALLAAPLRTIDAGPTPAASARAVATLLREAGERDALHEVGGVVVGLPRRLNGDDTHDTALARAFAAALSAASGLDVHLQDERLSSREAESRLAVTDRDWRSRKARLDAAAAAIILQDFLDGLARPASEPDPDEAVDA